MTKAAVAAAAAAAASLAAAAAAAAAADHRIVSFEGSKGREAKKVLEEDERGSRSMRSVVDSGSSKKTTTMTKGEEKFAPRFDGLRFIETLVTAHR